MLAGPVGYPFDGSLREGVSFQKYSHKTRNLFDYVSPPSFQYGSLELCKLLTDGAQFVKSNWKERLRVGDLSSEFGGPLAEHVNHQNGLEADVGLFAEKKKPPGHRAKKYNNRFPELFVDQKWTVSDNLDLQKTFELMEYFIEHATVEVILISMDITRQFMIRDLPGWNWERKLKVLPYLVHRRGHTDHFHLMLKCPPSSAECQVRPNFWKNFPGTGLKELCPAQKRECIREMTDIESQQWMRSIETIISKNKSKASRKVELPEMSRH